MRIQFAVMPATIQKIGGSVFGRHIVGHAEDFLVLTAAGIRLPALSSPGSGAHIALMAKTPKRDPAKHSKKDPAKPTRAKAARPDLPPTEPALADLLNPGIGQGTAGPGSQTGLQPPPDNSFDRRADFAAAHRARKSTPGLGEAPQRDY